MSALAGWAPRWPPLAPAYAVGGRALAKRLLANAQALPTFRGLVAGPRLAVTGSELPWVDGVEYFGRDGACGWLLVPTHSRPPFPTAWLEQRYRLALPGADWPCLLLPPGGALREATLLPIGRAAPFERSQLAAWSAEP